MALLSDPHYLTPTLPSWRHAIPSWAVGPTSAAPLSPHPHQVLQGRGGHSAKASLELMRVQPFRCQCKIQESTKTTRSPPIMAWCNQGPHPRKRKRRFRSVFSSTESAEVSGEDGDEGPEPEKSLRVREGSYLGSESSTVHRSVQNNPPTDTRSFLSSLSWNTAGQSWGDHGILSTPLGSELSSLNLLLTWHLAFLFLPLLPVPSPLLLAPRPWTFSRPRGGGGLISILFQRMLETAVAGRGLHCSFPF